MNSNLMRKLRWMRNAMLVCLSINVALAVVNISLDGGGWLISLNIGSAILCYIWAGTLADAMSGRRYF